MAMGVAEFHEHVRWLAGWLAQVLESILEFHAVCSTASGMASCSRERTTAVLQQHKIVCFHGPYNEFKSSGVRWHVVTPAGRSNASQGQIMLTELVQGHVILITSIPGHS